MFHKKAKKHPIKQRLVKFTNKNAKNRYIFASILSKKAKKNHPKMDRLVILANKNAQNRYIFASKTMVKGHYVVVLEQFF